MDVTAFVEFGGIEDSNHFFRLLDHDLVQQGFFEACCRDTAFDIERVHAEEEFVSAEVPERGDGKRSDGTMAVDAHMSAQEHDIKPLVFHEFGSDIHGVCDDVEVIEFMEMPRYFEGGSAGIEHDKIAVLDHLCRFFSDALFLLEVKHLLFGDCHIFVLVVDGFTHGSSPCADE